MPLLPAGAFVVVWSSGYIAGPAGVEVVAPFSLLGARFTVAAVLAVALAARLRGRLRIERRDLLRVCGVGLMMNALQFGLMYVAFDVGLGATLGSLFHSLSPVLTVVLAGVLLRERLRPAQVAGFVLGIAGVLLVLGPELDGAGGAMGVTMAVLSVLTLSLGSLGQRWIRHGPDPLWAAAIQFAVSAPPLVVLGLVLEGTSPVSGSSGQALGVVLYLAVVNSVMGLLLLGVLMRAGGAGASSSVFFLMPPVTAVLAFLFFGDTLGPRELSGLVVTVVGVAVATRRRAGRTDAAVRPG